MAYSEDVGRGRDLWLERWLPLLRERVGGSPVLELGCGPGEDTATLSRAGLRVIAIDRSPEAIAEAQARTPGAEYHCQDVRAPFPASAAGLGAVLASLSLHYFVWSETVTLVERIHDVLRIGGVLLCRLNSTEDHHHGASGHPAIDTHYYLVEGEPKRFFDRASIDRLFAKGWRVIDMGHHVVDRYARPKTLWEVILEKTGRLVVLAAVWLTGVIAADEASAQSPSLLLETRCEVWDTARRCVLWGPSLVELITRPEIYDGRRVRVVGWMNLAIEDSALYRSQGDSENGLRPVTPGPRLTGGNRHPINDATVSRARCGGPGTRRATRPDGTAGMRRCSY